MDLGVMCGKMADLMKVNSYLIRSMGMEYTGGQMGEFTLETGRKVSNTALANMQSKPRVECKSATVYGTNELG